MSQGKDVAPAKPAFAADAVHLLRTTQQIQYQLSQMADQKASMLLGITFLIFTITVGQLKSGSPQPALLVLGAAAFTAAFLTIMAVLPSVKSPPLSGKTDNILFFGSFTQMPQADYVNMLMEVMAEPRQVYETFARDIYQNGRVLALKKYRLLGYAYRVLLAGLVLSLIAFLVPFLAKAFAHQVPGMNGA